MNRSATMTRMVASPMPTQITLGSEAATAIPPTEARLKKLSEMFTHYCPASVVFQTPPPVEPK